MGKIFSRPKMPAAPSLPILTYTAPEAQAAQPAVGDPPAGAGGGNTDSAPEITADGQRLKNVLTRSRGRVGTIGTSFNGILGAVNASPVRKTLLGE